MVIQCPVCSTKFSIDGAEIGDRRDPQFHCSRCDCLFDLKGKTKSSGAHLSKDSTPATSELHSESVLSIQADIFGDYQQEQVHTTIDGVELAETYGNDQQISFLGTSEAPNVRTKHSMLRFNDDDDIYREGLPLIAAEWPDSRADRDLEIDLSEVTKRSIPYGKLSSQVETIEGNFLDESITLPNKKSLTESELITAVTPRFVMPKGDSWKSLPVEDNSISKQTEISRDSDTVQRIFDELEKSDKPAEIENEKLEERYSSDIPTFLEKTKGSILNFPLKDQIQSEIAKSIAKKNAEKEAAKKSAAPKKTVSWKIQTNVAAAKLNALSSSSFRALSILLIGPAVSTLALYLASQSPVSSVIPTTNIQKAPPAGLELEALRSEVKVLSDGSQFLEVTGTIHNNTPITYSEVSLVARSFDGQNQKSAEVLAAANNGLQHIENTQTLKSDMLLRLQQEKGLAYTIKPSEKISVRLALPIESNVPSYFDAEIYGVKRVRS
jgi:predicted Zn finger-like uncharacterized protein